MIKTIRKLIKLVKLLKHLEIEEQASEIILKINKKDLTLKIEGNTRLNTDYFLINCSPEFDPTQENAQYLLKQKTVGKGGCAGGCQGDEQHRVSRVLNRV